MIEIKSKRIALNLTQVQLANLLGVKQNTVSQWEKGRRRPTLDDIPKLASILGCTTDELLGIQKTPAEKQA